MSTKNAQRRPLRAALLVLLALAIATPAAALTARQFRSVAKWMSFAKDVRIEQLSIKTTGGDPEQPASIRIPGTGVAGAPICGFINGKFECMSVVTISCPDKIQLVQEGSNAIFSCETSCNPPTPDDEGYCDCDIDYGTCTPA